MICPDCKGRKVYVGLNKTEACRGCKGSGEVNDYGRGSLLPNYVHSIEGRVTAEDCQDAVRELGGFPPWAHKAGRDAAYAKTPYLSNPYPPNDKRWNWWAKGWTDGVKDIAHGRKQ